MPAPSGQTYSVAALVAAHTALRDLVDSHASLPGSLKIRDAADVLLAELVFSDPCGTVDGGTGQLTFDITPVPRDNSADASGTAAYGQICDGAGVVHLALPCQAGSAPVSGKLVMNTLSIVAGGPVELISATVG